MRSFTRNKMVGVNEFVTKDISTLVDFIRLLLDNDILYTLTIHKEEDLYVVLYDHDPSLGYGNPEPVWVEGDEVFEIGCFLEDLRSEREQKEND